jgi:hypothetical protein
VVVDESPDVSFYVFAEPALSAPEPEDWNIWQETAHLRTENLHWRECVTGIVHDVDRSHRSVDAVRESVNKHISELGTQIASVYHARSKH